VNAIRILFRLDLVGDDGDDDTGLSPEAEQW
jgi:hypothetical protein